MSEFSEIFKKVQGWEQLKSFAKSRVLLFSLAETALLGTSKKSLEIVRLAVQNKVYRRLARKYRNQIADFVAQHPTQAETSHRKTIWTCWLQGMENAPRIVQFCYQSVVECMPDREVVVITEDNFSDYVSFPDYILDKYKAGMITKVQFSDLLRIELLCKYGGTWLDGTVFCSGLIDGMHDFYLDSDLFLFQNLKPGLDGHCTSISSWMMTASSEQNIMLLVRALLHEYWRTHDFAVDYFILHDFFQMAIEAYPDEWKKVIPISNSIPHVLLLRLFNSYNDDIWNTIKSITPFHKLSYKLNSDDYNIEGTFYKEILE